MRKKMTVLFVSAALFASMLVAFPIHAQTGDGRGIIRKSPTTGENNPRTDHGSRMNMMNQMSEMMENCNSMMRNMQDHQPQMPNQQGTGPISPRSGN